jgi:hypothetical protein
MPCKAVPKAKQDAFEHICGNRRTVVKQLSDRQRASLHKDTRQRERHTRKRCATTVVKQLNDGWPADAQRMQGDTLSSFPPLFPSSL